MQPQTLEGRVERLERRMPTVDEMPARVATLESQIPQLRQEMDERFSAIQGEVKAGDEDSCRYMKVLYEDTLERIKVMGEADARHAQKRID